MSVIKKTLEENYIFFIRELSRIEEELKNVPKGNLSPKRISKSTYYYHQQKSPLTYWKALTEENYWKDREGMYWIS